MTAPPEPEGVSASSSTDTTAHQRRASDSKVPVVKTATGQDDASTTPSGGDSQDSGLESASSPSTGRDRHSKSRSLAQDGSYPSQYEPSSSTTASHSTSPVAPTFVPVMDRLDDRSLEHQHSHPQQHQHHHRQQQQQPQQQQHQPPHSQQHHPQHQSQHQPQPQHHQQQQQHPQHHPRHVLHVQHAHHHVYQPAEGPTHYIAAGLPIPQPLPESLRYAEQPAYTLRPVYAPQMYYEQSLAAADYGTGVDASGAPTVVYPTLPPRSSPGAYPAAALPHQPYHPDTTPTAPQGAWTTPGMAQPAYYGSYPAMTPQLGSQHTGATADDMGHGRPVYMTHAPAPPSAWSPSPVISTPYQFFSAYQPGTERMDNLSPVGEHWSPPPQQGRPLRAGYVPPHGQQGGAGPSVSAVPSGAGAWPNQPPNAGPRDKCGSLSAPGDESLQQPRPSQQHSAAQHADNRERKDYHPQPPARRSEWVMWVGNVPSNVSHEELWRFFNTTTPPSAVANPSEPWRGPSSIFLISRSSCAFVNFSSQADLDRAVPYFHGLSLRPWDPRCPRMVCRIRHKDDDLRAGVGAQRGVGMHRSWVDQNRQERQHSTVSPKSAALELAGDDNGAASGHDHSSGNKSSASFASTNSSFLAHHFPRRYFILKSLTISDLEESVKTCLWKTQRHNQPILDQAFRTSQEVFLIFGANRSGEFFGYAKMVAPSVRPKASDRQPSLLRTSYSSLQGLSNPGPRLQLSQPTPIREEGESPLRSATDPYNRRQSTAWLAPGARAASPGALDEADELLEGEHVSPKIEVGYFRSDSPDALEESMRRISVNTLDPNLLRERRESSRVFRMSHLEPSNSLQIPLATGSLNVQRKESLAVPGPGRMDSTLEGPARMDSTHEAPARSGSVAETDPDNTLALPFRLQWVKVAPLSFLRTRHLRNPWNGDREVKVSRDGTELEPNVGMALTAEWDKLEREAEEGETEEGATRGDSASPDKKAAV